jgi:hypothetical protein
MRRVSTIPVLAWVLLSAGCATEHLSAAAPTGVNLTGEWNFNPNLSDDPNKLGDSDKSTPRTPGSHRGHGGGRGGGGGGGGMPPIGSSGGGYNYLPVALPGGPPDDTGATGDTSQPAPAAPPARGAPGRGSGAGRFLKAPAHLSITQQEGNITIRTNMPDGTRTVDEYRVGTTDTIPYGHNSSADRSVGWRGPVFVITTTVKQGDWREDDFALDEDGRLIMTTQTKAGHRGTLEIKRVYDRVRGAQSQPGGPE